MNDQPVLGWWLKNGLDPETGAEAVRSATHQVARPLFLLQNDRDLSLARGGAFVAADHLPAGRTPGSDCFPVQAYVPPLHPEQFGSARFKADLNIRYPYVIGAMANGITSVVMVKAAGKAGMIGFFGAAGLVPAQIDDAILHLQRRLDGAPFGFNLIHSPFDPELEKTTVALYLKRGVQVVSASAFMTITPHLVHYRLKGLHRSDAGQIIAPNRVIAKVSREEVAARFLSPPPEKAVAALRGRGLITETEARLAASIPMADGLTAEADSGGHTDNRAALTLFPIMTALRDVMTARHGYAQPPCIGLAGGIATPTAAAAAFAMGADYVLTGSINQSCLEAGTSEAVRRMLASAGQADVTMAPAADMFEMGVKVQVLKRGTMFALRAAKLYELYDRHPRYEDIPPQDRSFIEKTLFRRSFEEEWESTRAYFAGRDPAQIEKAVNDPRHRMALVFRSYLGQSSHWANAGDPARRMDYQIWCGPAMGAFNRWTSGTFLEGPEKRRTVTVALNLLWGAAVLERLRLMRHQGVVLPPGFDAVRPQPLNVLNAHLGGCPAAC